MDLKLFEVFQAITQAHDRRKSRIRTRGNISPRRKTEEKADNRRPPFPPKPLRWSTRNTNNEELDVPRSEQPTLREIEATRITREREMGLLHKHGRLIKGP